MVALSSQQQAIIDWVSEGAGSLVVLARAGTGKTFTIKRVVKEIVDKRLGDCYVGAFNRAIADEVKHDINTMGVAWKECAVNTAHGFGFGLIRKVWPGVKVDNKKMLGIIDAIAEEELHETGESGAKLCAEQIAKLVSFGKQRGLGFSASALESANRDESWWRIVDHYGIDDLPDEISIPALIAYAREALKRSAALDSTVIDFDDMVLLPITRNLRAWPRQWVFIDEAQDTNPVRRALFSKMLKRGGRLVAVGDDRQAINGFAGADADALDQIRQAFNAATLPLTTTYRCPARVVALAQSIVPDIVAHETAPEGTIEQWSYSSENPFWFVGERGPRAGDAILCRTTAPLIDTAYSLIRKGIGCRVEGRDIGAGLIALVRRFKVKTIEALINKIEAWSQREIEKWTAKNREDKAASCADRTETLLTLCARMQEQQKQSVAELVAEIEYMFADTTESNSGKIVLLSTIHKSKGREFNRVFFLNHNKCPAFWARRAWEVDQEHNLIYVAYTRAKQELVLVATED